MATIAKLVAELSLADKMSGGLKKTRDNLNEFGDSTRKLGAKVALGLTTPVVAGFSKMVMAASDLNEAASATETIYGKSAKSILNWSKTTADGYGISQSAALGAVNTFGQVFKGVGITTEAASGLSTQLIESAGDLASFYDKVPTDVLRDLQSGIVGQYEPLLKYGIVLNEATVSQKAMTMTGKTNVKMLTDAEKIAARTALITEGLGAAQGDAARTSNSLANMLRRLRARGADLAARWGQLLLPRMQKFVGFLLDLTTRIENLSPKMQKFALIGLAIAAAIGPAIYVVGVLASVLALLLSPIGLLVVGVGALAALFGGDLIRSFDSIIGYVKTFITVMGLAYGNTYAVKDLVEFLPEPLQRFERGLLLIANAAGHLVRAFEHHGIAGVFEVLPRELDNVWTAIKQLVGGMASLALDFVIDTAVSIGGWVADHASDVWEGIRTAAGWVAGKIPGAIEASLSVSMEAIGEIKIWKNKVGDWIKLQLFGETGSSTTIDDITAKIKPTLELATDVDWAGIAKDIALGVVQAVRDAAYNFTPMDMARFAYDFGQALGPAINEGISRAFNAIKADPIGAAKVALAIVAAITALFLSPIILGAALTAALAVWIGAGIVALAAGIASGMLGIDFGQVAQSIGTAITDGIAELGDWSDKLSDKGFELLQGLADGADQKFAQIWAWVQGRPDVITTGIGDVTTTLKQKGIDLLSGLLVGLTEKWSSVVVFMVNFPEWGRRAIGDVTTTLTQKGMDLIDGFHNGARKKWEGVTHWLVGLPGALLDWAPDFSSTLYQAGLDVVQGFANGLYAGAGLVTSAVGYLVSLIPGPVRSILNMNSPSKLMRDIMINVPKGMALGMMDGKSLVARAASSLGAAAIPQLGGMGVAGSVSGSTVSAGNTNNYGGITIIVDGAGDPTAVADRVFAKFSRELALHQGGL